MPDSSPRVSSRRSLLLSGSALLAIATMRNFVSPAWGQEGQAQAVERLRKDLDTDRDIANGFYKRLSNGERMEEGARKEIAETSFKLRVERANSLQAIFRSSPNPDATLAPLLYPETAFLADEMRAQSVSPVPPPEDIKPDPTQSVPPSQDKAEIEEKAATAELTATEKTAETAEKPEKWEIVVVILLETLGLADEFVLIQKILTQLSGYEDERAKVIRALSAGQPKSIIDSISNFGKWFFTQRIVKEFLALLAGEIASKTLRQFSLRLIPWIGWGWMLVSFGLAVHRHWDELMA